MLGKLLKYNRIKQGKKQEDICRDICSVSYYSKIENNRINPADEVFEQLLNRLNLTSSDLEKLDYEEMKRKLINWHSLIIRKQTSEAERVRNELAEEIEYFHDSHIQLMYLLFAARFAVFKEDIHYLEELRQAISEFSLEEVPEDIKFYYEKIHTIIYIFFERYDQSRNHACLASDYSKEVVLPEEELIDHFALLGRVGLETGDYSISIDFTQRAINVYDRDYNLHLSGACRVLLARAYRKVLKFEKAIEELDKVAAISEQTQNTRLEAEVLQMRGEIYAQSNKQMDAIHCFQQSYRMRSGRERLVTIHSILQEFEKLDSGQDILSWVAHGMETISKLKNKRMLIPFDEKYELKFLYYLVSYDRVHEKDFEATVKEKILPFFEDLQDWVSIAFYSEKLGSYYEKRKEFDESLIWYKKSIQSLWARARY
ncbi:helix-turn-helix transcriptional regulator [Alkalicoccus halolimnae]|uniref:Helix-turn-helix transcriptional regulator n=1 Tax=Alkalicoccus halolimnae TaxID=1667239 RepID=A0A5C7F6A9_9BACI|nr:helix-turn-helix transcriptional regulator [Alkalicoccus halolimnae]TXF85100.1 helix-turn-helix domain-containing protein [Alkalicoccus halolimnae]